MTISPRPIRIGTAGWTLPKQLAPLFPEEGSHLIRYAQRLNCVEINSSFYRPHLRSTWERWAATTPDDFRFSVKLPKTITHVMNLINAGALLQDFLNQVRGLGGKLGTLLVQLPPKLAFDEGTAQEFFTTLREQYDGAAVLEPRHTRWFAPGVNRMLRNFEISCVAADPPQGSALAGRPSGWNGLHYHRLHGAPQTYYSNYSEEFLEQLAKELRIEEVETWVVFDNTALGHATQNALHLSELLDI